MLVLIRDVLGLLHRGRQLSGNGEGTSAARECTEVGVRLDAGGVRNSGKGAPPRPRGAPGYGRELERRCPVSVAMVGRAMLAAIDVPPAVHRPARVVRRNGNKSVSVASREGFHDVRLHGRDDDVDVAHADGVTATRSGQRVEDRDDGGGGLRVGVNEHGDGRHYCEDGGRGRD